MKKSRPGLTRQEHQVIGAELRRVHGALTTTLVEAVNAYGPGNRRIRRIEPRLRTIMNSLATVRSELEELLAEDHADWQTSDYYGGTDADMVLARTLKELRAAAGKGTP
jgi:hypothetical protein